MGADIRLRAPDPPFPFLFGAIKAGRVSSINIYSYATKENHRVSVTELENGPFKLYYVFLDDAEGTKFDLTAFTDTNRVIHAITIDDENFEK